MEDVTVVESRVACYFAVQAASLDALGLVLFEMAFVADGSEALDSIVEVDSAIVVRTFAGKVDEDPSGEVVEDSPEIV